ncbi:MAG TPA: MlaD family protein [Candidatus Solibacter sp.]|jgi:virulence factor Mce-like protein|nr:MlaD family protein [Candidatus Solibacter sp.]
MPNRGPRVNPAFVGLVSAAVMFGLLFFAFANVSLFASNMDVKAQVASGDTLAPNADVEVAGVRVGLVKSIDKGNPGALIDMSVDTKKVTLYRDATLQIRPHGVFGPKFVEFNPGTPSAGSFGDGDSVPMANTSVSVDLEQVFNELDTNTRQSLQTVFYELGTGSQNRGADFGQTIDKLNTVETQLTPVLQVIDNRSFETGRFLESSAVVNETFAASPFDQIIKKNADVLTKLDIASASVQGVVVHGNNVLVSLDAITGGSNTQALAQSISKLPTLFDNVQLFNNALGYGVNALLPVLTPQRGQALSDIGLAVARTQDAFGQCDITDQTSPPPGADTPHANIVKIVPCYDSSGNPYRDASGHVAHHHVNVLLGLHTNPAAPGVAAAISALAPVINLANTIAPGTGTQFAQAFVAENEGSVICGPNSGNSTRPVNPAFTCKTNSQSKAIPGFGTKPPPLFAGSTAAALGSSSPVTVPAVSASGGMPNTSRGTDIIVALLLVVAGVGVGFGLWRTRRA